MQEIRNQKPEPLTGDFFRDYLMLSKFRLSLSVVGTTLIAYWLGVAKNPIDFNWIEFAGLAIGGMFVVAASNGFNQVYEKDTDILMTRTMNRPVAAGRMTAQDAIVFSSVCAVIGLILLTIMVNGRVALLSLMSLFTYTLAYTPLKKVSPLAVIVGAIPGALPPAIGWVGAVGHIDEIAIILFMIQFFWQFPHFWSIAWILEDDYRKAGYTLLPNFEGRTKSNAMKLTWYSIILILLSLYPLRISFGSLNALFVILPAGAWLLYNTLRLQKTLEVKDARMTMFATLIYIPMVLISYLF